MTNTSRYEQASLHVTFSHLVRARNTMHAMNLAQFHLNEESMLLDRIQLVNERGCSKTVKVERITSVQWLSADPHEYSNQFKVIGHIQLALSIDRLGMQKDGATRKDTFQLPRSTIQDQTIWVIPTCHEPVFTQVISQSIQPGSRSLEAEAIHIAG